MRRHALITIGLLVAILPPPARGEAVTYQAADSIRIDHAATDAASAALRDLAWKPSDFTVTVTSPPPPHPTQDTDADALVTFASPRPSGDPADAMNTVVLEWYRARSPSGQPLVRAPAMLTLHILDNRFILERGIARALSRRGIHCFVMHDPGWGRRRAAGSVLDGTVFFERATQAVADARRSRDAIAALPGVEPNRISLQGASLGGFLAASAGAIDRCFDNVFILLAGGNLYDMFITGQNEAQRIRRALAAAGYEGDKLRALCDRVEPTRLASRLDAAHTWLFSASADQVVPAASAQALAAAAGLAPSHHQWLTGDHYTAILNIPWLVNYMADVIAPK